MLSSRFGLVYLGSDGFRRNCSRTRPRFTVIIDRETGFLFAADDIDSLAETLLGVKEASADSLNAIVEQAHEVLAARYSGRATREYRMAIDGSDRWIGLGRPAVEIGAPGPQRLRVQAAAKTSDT